MRRRAGIGRVGRPSLIGTAARTAVVAGTASAVVGRSQTRQAAQADQAAAADAWRSQQAQDQADQAAAAAAAAAAPPAVDVVSQLERLAALRQQGLLTDVEFEAQKAKLLGS